MQIENLVFEGGGVKGIAYADIPNILQEYGILNNIKKVAGSSAGSIAALLFALKCSPERIEGIITRLDFTEFYDFNIFYSVFRMIFKSGLHSGDALSDWIQCRILMETGSRYTNFKALYDRTGIELVITATNLDRNRTDYFSYKTSPEMEVWKAVRMSCALPSFFDHVRYRENCYTDGGLKANYPIWVFNNEDTYQKTFESTKDKKTMGFRLVSDEADYRESSYNEPFAFPIVYLFYRIIYMLYNSNYTASISEIADIDRTVIINVGDVKAEEFDISNITKDLLKKKGRDATLSFIKKKSMKDRFKFGNDCRKEMNDMIRKGSHQLISRGDITRISKLDKSTH
jgi:NTE family protein